MKIKIADGPSIDESLYTTWKKNGPAVFLIRKKNQGTAKYQFSIRGIHTQQYLAGPKTSVEV